MRHCTYWLGCTLAIAGCIAINQAGAQATDTVPNPYGVHRNVKHEKLYFVPATGAVETEPGKAIFNRGFVMELSDYDVPEVELPVTFFDLIDTSTSAGRDDAMQYRYNYCTFNHSGDFLYHPFWYDNGPDYWVEGRRRFVENGKMGLVNRLGQRIVPARDYTFISPVQQGFAIACRDCKYTITDTADKEHGWAYIGTLYDLLDANGHIAARLPPGSNPRDAMQLQRRYHNPKTVAKLAAMLYALPETMEAASNRELKKSEVHFVCYDEPTSAVPWYHFGLEETGGSMAWPDVQFLVSPDGKNIQFINHALDRSTPYKIWRLRKNKFD